MKSATLGLAFVLGLVACGPVPQAVAPDQTLSPKRIVSLDFCADQYVLKLADPGQIVAVSKDAVREFSYMREAAHAYPKIATTVEAALAARPDLVVRSYGGGLGATAALERAGVSVLDVGYPQTLAEIESTTLRLGKALGRLPEAETVVDQMRQRLAAVRTAGAKANAASALYVTPSGVTTGPGSWLDALMVEAGLVNFETQPGWRPLPLERLARETPAVLVTAFFNQTSRQQDIWSTARHPLTQRLLATTAQAALDGAVTACPAWYALDAIETLAAVRR